MHLLTTIAVVLFSAIHVAEQTKLLVNYEDEVNILCVSTIQEPVTFIFTQHAVASPVRLSVNGKLVNGHHRYFNYIKHNNNTYMLQIKLFDDHNSGFYKCEEADGLGMKHNEVQIELYPNN